MKPFIGFPVVVPVTPASDGDATEAVGIVSRVWSDDNVSVRVFPDSNDVGWRPGLTLLTEKPAEEDGPPADNVCWPLPAPVRDTAPDEVPTEDPATGDATPVPATGKRSATDAPFSEGVN
jgi:hypothetical protein